MTDQTDIVTRLRRPMNVIGFDDITEEAAELIERLRTELEESERLLDEYQREAADRTRWENT